MNNKLILILGLITLLILSGCSSADSKSTSMDDDCFPFCNDDVDEINIKKISISGVDKTQQVSSVQPVELVISGVRNTITVLDETTVEKITVSGTDIVITLPKGSNPEITDSGVRTQIKYN